MNKYFHQTIFFLFSLSSAFSQSSIESSVKSIMDNVRTGKAESTDTKTFYKSENQVKVITSLSGYLNDTSYVVRDKSYSLIASVAKKSSNKAIRKQAVNTLLKGCNDAKPFVSKNSGRLLEQFVKEDFDELAKEELKKMVGQSTDNRGQFAKLAAWVGINDIEPILISFLNEKMSSKDKLDIRLALARLGHS